MEDDNRLSYFFLGVGLGVAVGVLFAPKAGRETRELLRNKAEESGEFVKRKSVEIREQAADVIDRSKETIRRQKENLAAAVDAGRSAYREAVNAPQAD